MLCVALAPIERAVGLAAVRVATYQAVSGAGRAGLETLANEETAALTNGPPPAGGAFAAPIFRNVVPQVGSFDGDGDTGEEQKVVAETRKMLGRPDLHVAATTVRVPVRRAHSEAVFFETEAPDHAGRIGRRVRRMRRASCSTNAASSRRATSRAPTSCTSRACGPNPIRDTLCRCGSSAISCAKARQPTACRSSRLLVEQGRFAVASGAARA